MLPLVTNKLKVPLIVARNSGALSHVVFSFGFDAKYPRQSPKRWAKIRKEDPNGERREEGTCFDRQTRNKGRIDTVRPNPESTGYGKRWWTIQERQPRRCEETGRQICRTTLHNTRRTEVACSDPQQNRGHQGGQFRDPGSSVHQSGTSRSLEARHRCRWCTGSPLPQKEDSPVRFHLQCFHTRSERSTEESGSRLLREERRDGEVQRIHCGGTPSDRGWYEGRRNHTGQHQRNVATVEQIHHRTEGQETQVEEIQDSNGSCELLRYQDCRSQDPRGETELGRTQESYRVSGPASRCLNRKSHNSVPMMYSHIMGTLMSITLITPLFEWVIIKMGEVPCQISKKLRRLRI